MNWQPIDFQGIVDLDRKIIEQLEQFLQEKENRLAHQISNTIFTFSFETDKPSIPVSDIPVKLSEAVEKFTKKVRLSITGETNESFPPDKVIKDINAILWEFTSVLEGCAIELFQRIHQVPIDRWHVSISEVVYSIKNILIHYLEDLIWIIRRLEKPLKEYCQKFPLQKEKKWRDWFSFREGILDHHLLEQVHQTEKFIKDQYEEFLQHYNEYVALNVQVEADLEKMKSYPILALLDISDQNVYVDAFRLLKMLELNPHPKKAVALATVRALKRLTGIDNLLRVLRVYHDRIKEAFFNISIEWKSLSREEAGFSNDFERLQASVGEYQRELHSLRRTMSSYRTFILINDPNPYVRSRWGFSERIVGPEPAKAKKLANMIYSVNELDENFTRFHESLLHDPLLQQQVEYQAHQVIEKLLHEMGQPLISRSIMRNHAEQILDQLRLCDEIGSPHVSTIFYVEDVLSKVMRQDWKYHILHEFPLFHEIYRLHHGLVEYFDDPGHTFRLERFRLLFDQIIGWVEKEDIYSHVNEIDLDVNDMKTYLQDFLATIQRITKEKSNDPFLDETIHKLRNQLLEYRYLFGQFFSSIMSRSSDGIQLRHQFLFIDQYFESVENLLNELNASWKGKR